MRLKLRTPIRNRSTGQTGMVAGVQSNPDCYLVKTEDGEMVFWNIGETVRVRRQPQMVSQAHTQP